MTQSPELPDQSVARRIIEALRAQQLLSEAALARLEPRLADGTMTADDWAREVERDAAELGLPLDDDARC